MLDIAMIFFVFLPLYGCMAGGYIYSVNLFSLGDISTFVRCAYWTAYIVIIILGAAKLISVRLGKAALGCAVEKVSLLCGVLTLCLLIATLEPYAAVLLLVILAAKILILIKLREKASTGG